VNNLPKKSKKNKKIELIDFTYLPPKELFILYKKKKDPEIREYLITKYLKLVEHLVKKFIKRKDFIPDLIQVGILGLINAIDRYDPKKGAEFLNYAIPTIVGEIKRYLRDKASTIRIPRDLQKLNKSVNKAIYFLKEKLGRNPTISEIADYLNLPEEEILETMELVQIFNPVSLDKEIIIDNDEFPALYSNITGDVDKKLEMIGDITDLKEALKYLNEKEKKVIEYKFYKNMTQIEIAKKMRISQMQVSRLQNVALLKLRKILLTGSLTKS
jgi:RNA polymerase sigma-B factor